MTNNPRGKSQLVKKGVSLGKLKTSLRLEEAFWDALKGIAASQGTSVARLVAWIDSDRQHANLSSAIRLFVLDYYRST
jgi:predicted DNA-binding ribbon-helix-helix protein